MSRIPCIAMYLAASITLAALAAKALDGFAAPGDQVMYWIATGLEVGILLALVLRRITVASIQMLVLAIGGTLWALFDSSTPCRCMGDIIILDQGARLALNGFMGTAACLGLLGTISIESPC